MSGTPVSRILHYRLRSDGGAVDAAPTWIANEDTSGSVSPGSNFRLRATIDNTGTGSDNGNNPTFSRCGIAAGAFGVVAGVINGADASSDADATAITVRRLTAGTGSFSNGVYDENETISVNVPAGGHTEYELGLVMTGGASAIGVGGGESWQSFISGLTDAPAVTPAWTTPDVNGSDFSHGPQLGGASQKVANSASISMTTAVAAASGDLVVVVVTCDNSSTSNGDHSDVSSVSIGGNAATKAVEFTNAGAGVQSGSVVSVWYLQLTGALGSGSTITANFANAATNGDACTIQARAFTVAAGKTVSVEATNSAATNATQPSSLDATTASIECLRVCAHALEGGLSAANVQNDLRASNNNWSFWWTSGNMTRTTGTAATDSTSIVEARISTGTGAASQIGAFVGGDWASAYVAFKATSSATPITTNDALSLGVGESLDTITALLSRFDIAQVAVNETSAILAALDRFDVAGLSASDSSAIVAILEQFDALGLSVSDASAVAAVLTISDALSISVSETSEIMVQLARLDVAGLAVSETPTIEATLAVADALGVSISDASTLLALVETFDAAGVSVSDQAVIVVALSVLDSLGLAISDASQLTALLERADELGLSTSELSTLLVTIERSDVLAAVISDSRDLVNLVTVLDATGVALSETSAVTIAGIIELAASDALSLAVSDAATVAVLISALDTLGVHVSETSSVVAFLERLDALGLSLGDTATILASLDRTDQLGISLSELSSIVAIVQAFDSVSVALSDAALKEDVGGAVVVNVADALGLSTHEAATLLVAVAVSDSLSLSVDQAVAIFTTLEAADACGVAVSDAVNILASLSADDIVALALGDQSVAIATLEVADALGVDFTEVLDIVVTNFNIRRRTGTRKGRDFARAGARDFGRSQTDHPRPSPDDPERPLGNAGIRPKDRH